MSFYFDLNISFWQGFFLLALLLLLACELVYLYAVYNRVSRYARRAKGGAVRYTGELPGVSVIVYADADNGEGVGAALDALLAQEYGVYEIIVVNDDAGDRVRHIVSCYECEHKNVYQTFVPEAVCNVSRKKLGITLGVKAARYDVVVVTEADCVPVSRQWLSKMARNFVPGVDVVLGYTRMAVSEDGCDSRYVVFDRVVFALRYLSYAVMHRAYMGVSGNLAYRKECFFAHNGFSSTLNLRYGDDDLFVNEVARGRNVRVELSHRSVMECHCADNRRTWAVRRMRYGFTSRYLHTSAKVVFAMESVLHYVTLAVAVAAVWVGFPGLLCMIAALLLVALYWIAAWRVYLRAGRVLGESFGSGLVPLYLLLRPWTSWRYAMMRKKENKSYFTWQYLR